MSEHVSEDVAEHVQRAAEGVRRVVEGVEGCRGCRGLRRVRSMSCYNVVSLRPDLHCTSVVFS